MAASSGNFQERRVIMIGKTGNGKSSTANTLLGREVFKCGQSLKAVTESCSKKNYKYIGRHTYVFIDTPGLLDEDSILANRALEIQRSVEICPEPHAFLLVFNGATRHTKDDSYTIDLMRIIFGEKVFDHCIIVFTHGKKFTTESDFKKYWKSSESFVKLAERCGNRVTSIENSENHDNNQNIRNGEHILTMIEHMSERGTKAYKYGWIRTHKKALEDHISQTGGTGSVTDELDALVKRLGTMLNKDVWTAVLVGGVVVGAGAIGLGAAGYGVYMAGSALLGSAAATAAPAASSLGASVLNGAVTIGGTVLGAAWKLVRFR